jgi:hypothetical protein
MPGTCPGSRGNVALQAWWHKLSTPNGNRGGNLLFFEGNAKRDREDATLRCQTAVGSNTGNRTALCAQRT